MSNALKKCCILFKSRFFHFDILCHVSTIRAFHKDTMLTNVAALLAHFNFKTWEIRNQSVSENHISMLYTTLVQYFSNGKAKTNLAMLSLFYLDEFVKDSVDGKYILACDFFFFFIVDYFRSRRKIS